MNQILQTKIKNQKTKLKKFKKILKIQLYSSIILSIIIVISISFNAFHLYKQEKYSNQILSNYNITKLYSNLSSNEISSSNETIENVYIIGIIEIPKINIYYPIFSTCTDELLKISPCKFYGTSPGHTRQPMYCWS